MYPPLVSLVEVFVKVTTTPGAMSVYRSGLACLGYACSWPHRRVLHFFLGSRAARKKKKKVFQKHCVVKNRVGCASNFREYLFFNSRWKTKELRWNKSVVRNTEEAIDYQWRTQTRRWHGNDFFSHKVLRTSTYIAAITAGVGTSDCN